MGRWESAVRTALHATCAEWVEGDAVLLDEFWVPRTHERADIAAIGKDLVAIEIKTHVDTLRRLERQVEAYGRLFDRCIACVAEPHLSGTVGHVPDWWMIVTYPTHDPYNMDVYRAGATNPDDPDPDMLVRLLWKGEVRAALSRLGCEFDPASGRHELWDQLLAGTTVPVLKGIVRQALRTRDLSTARIPTKRMATPIAQAS